MSQRAAATKSARAHSAVRLAATPGTKPTAPDARQPAQAQHKGEHPYRSVSIYSRAASPCKALERITGARFLAAAAPQLPLGECSHPETCRCRYQYHLDRRQEIRRDADYGLPSKYYWQTERRVRQDRRKAG